MPRGFIIVCYETGEKFRSVKDAAEAHGCTESQISYHLRKRYARRNVNGRNYYYETPPIDDITGRMLTGKAMEEYLKILAPIYKKGDTE